LQVPAHETVRLVDVCHARSGDKGRHCTIGLIAWDPRIFGVLVQQVTPAAVARHFGDLVRGPVHTYPLPGISAISLILEDALDGGGVRSLRLDAQGKAMGEALLRMEITLPADLAQAVELRSWPGTDAVTANALAAGRQESTGAER
jgi:hypothetical protein